MSRYLFLLVLLAGCAANGPLYTESKEPVTILYRPPAIVGAAARYSIDVNGKPYCELHNGSFVAIKETGTISSSQWAYPGTSRITVNKPSFVRMERNDGKDMAGAILSFPGLWASEAISNNAGPYIFTIIDAEQAKKELTGLHQDCI